MLPKEDSDLHFDGVIVLPQGLPLESGLQSGCVFKANFLPYGRNCPPGLRIGARMRFLMPGEGVSSMACHGKAGHRSSGPKGGISHECNFQVGRVSLYSCSSSAVMRVMDIGQVRMDCQADTFLPNTPTHWRPHCKSTRNYIL